MLDVLYLISFLTGGAMLMHLALRGHLRTIPWFAVLCASSLCLEAVGLALGTHHKTYCTLYWPYLPLSLLLSILVTREIVSLICEQHRGLRWYWFDNLFLSGLASVLVALTVFPFTNRSRAACTWLQCGFAAFLEISAILNFAVFVFACTTVYLAFRFVPNVRPLKLHAVLWAGLMFVTAYRQLSFILVRPNQGADWVDAANAMGFLAAILSQVLWMAVLHRPSLLEATPGVAVYAEDDAPVAAFTEFVSDLGETGNFRRRQ